VIVGQFLEIFAFLSVLLRGFELAFEALTIGGVVFVTVVDRGAGGEEALGRASHWIRAASLSLTATQICATAATGKILIGTTDLGIRDLPGASFFVAGLLVLTGAVAIAIFAQSTRRAAATPPACLLILAGSVMLSHSAARLEHRSLLIALTVLHHAASAAWIGALPYLLIALRHAPDSATAERLTARFSRLAMFSVAILTVAGTGLGLAYVGSAAALTGTTYGIMLLGKVIFTAILLLFGALNFTIVRSIMRGLSPALLPLRRMAEVEVGIGFTVLLAAASLTSAPPAVDVRADRVNAHEIAQRFAPRWPRMSTPPVNELSPATSFATEENLSFPGSFVPGQVRTPPKPADIAWSEYNHHWSGLVVLAIGVLAALAYRYSWARHWPLAFFGLAIFLLIRADSENWPLGPRGFWESFRVAEVAQHRFFVLLIVGFAIFEWAVQMSRIALLRAGLVFPLVCAVGGALLLMHSHSLGNVKEEFLAEVSHIPLAILGVVAGWSRWLEIRLPANRVQFVAKRVWPVCFVLIGCLLLSYRES
jgi:putative copper resistance protein D